MFSPSGSTTIHMEQTGIEGGFPQPWEKLELAKRYQRFGVDNSLQQNLLEFAMECADLSNFVILAEFGQFVDLYTKRPVFIPVLTEALIEASSDYLFDPNISQQHSEALLNNLLALMETHDTSSMGNTTHYELLTFSEVEDHCLVVKSEALPIQKEELSAAEKTDAAAQVLDDEDYAYLRYKKHPVTGYTCEVVACRALGNLRIYRPESDLHIQFSGESEVVLETHHLAESEQVFKPAFYEVMERKIRNYRIFKISPKMGNRPTWVIRLISEQTLPIKTMPIPYLNCASHEFMEILGEDVDFESTLKTLVKLELDTKVLKQQIRKHHTFMPNGLELMIEQFLANARFIARLLHVEHEGTEYYFPNYFGDMVTTVEKHYRNKKVILAGDTVIKALRRYNNKVKMVLIEKFVPYGSSVLDLACGHGQDMLKYRHRRIVRYVGIDLAIEAIKEARLRATQSALNYPVEFHVGNLRTDKAFVFLKKTAFDVVSMQLALHYFLDSRMHAVKLLQRVYAHLKPGGLFIGSVSDCDALADRMSTLTAVLVESENGTKVWNYQFGNSLYKVTLDEEFARQIGEELGRTFDTVEKSGIITLSLSETAILREKLNHQWGLSYSFYLIQAIENLAEFNVPWRAFCEVAKEVGFRTLLAESFPDFCDHHLDTFKKWSASQNLHLSEEEKPIFGFYRVFCFVKGTALKEALHTDNDKRVKAISDPNNFSAGVVIRKRKRNTVGANGYEAEAKKAQIH